MIYGATPKEWVLTFEHDGDKVKTVVEARTFIGARGFAPTGATNVKVRQHKPRSREMRKGILDIPSGEIRRSGRRT